MSESISNWQPVDAKDPSGFVMPYTQGGPTGTNSVAVGTDTVQAGNDIPGFTHLVPGNTDTGSHPG